MNNMTLISKIEESIKQILIETKDNKYTEIESEFNKINNALKELRNKKLGVPSILSEEKKRLECTIKRQAKICLLADNVEKLLRDLKSSLMSPPILPQNDRRIPKFIILEAVEGSSSNWKEKIKELIRIGVKRDNLFSVENCSLINGFPEGYSLATARKSGEFNNNTSYKVLNRFSCYYYNNTKSAPDGSIAWK